MIEAIEPDVPLAEPAIDDLRLDVESLRLFLEEDPEMGASDVGGGVDTAAEVSEAIDGESSGVGTPVEVTPEALAAPP